MDWDGDAWQVDSAVKERIISFDLVLQARGRYRVCISSEGLRKGAGSLIAFYLVKMCKRSISTFTKANNLQM